MKISKNNNEPQNSLNKNKSQSSLIISSDLPIQSLYQILSKNPNLVNIIDNNGETLLSYSIKRKKQDICQLILSSKILDLSYQDKLGNSYLHLAIMNNLEGVVKTLIEKGIYINMQNNDGNTPLHFAYIYNTIPIIHILKNNHIDTEIKNNDNKIAENLKNSYLKIEKKVKENSSNEKIKESKIKTQINDIFYLKYSSKLSSRENHEKKKNKPASSSISYKNSIKRILNKNNPPSIKSYIIKKPLKNFANSPLQKKLIDNKKDNKKNLSNRATPINENKKIKKGKSKKNIENEKNKKEKNPTEENFTNNNNKKQNYIDMGNNTSGETKYKSGNYKDKINKVKVQEQLEDQQRINKNINSRDDIFNIAESMDYKQKLAHTSELNSQIVQYPKNLLIRKKKSDFQEDDLVNLSENMSKYIYNKNNDTKKNNIIFNEQDDLREYENNENESLNGDDDDYDDEFKFEEIQNENENKEEENEYDEEQILEQNKSSLNYFENSLFSDNCRQKSSKTNEFQGRNYSEFPKIKDFRINYLTNNESSNQKNNDFSHRTTPFYYTKNEEIDNNKMNYKNYYIKNPKSQARKTFSKQLLDNNQDEILLYKQHINSNIVNSEYNINLEKFKFNNAYSQGGSIINNKNIDQNNSKTNNQPLPPKNNNALKEFLSQINMLKYLNNFIQSGFDEINLIIDQAQRGIYIKDNELKEADILLPGDRAKILIRIQEKAGNFGFTVPKSVYYVCQNLNMIQKDENISKLNNWLKNLKIENYLMNFVYSGYHSIELLLLQMESKNPLTVEILKDEIGIDKIGHRSRIINKLKEEARSYNNKLKASTLIVGNGEKNNNCECLIF